MLQVSQGECWGARVSPFVFFSANTLGLGVIQYIAREILQAIEGE
jgi:hypothetical protein